MDYKLETKCSCGKIIRSSLKRNYKCKCGNVYTPSEFEALYLKRRDIKLNYTTELEQNEKLTFEGIAREDLEFKIIGG